MQNTTRSLILALVCVLLLSACSSLPEHARYIPKDASVVVGVNVKEIGKSLTWSAITGSKLLDEMKEKARSSKGKSVIDGIEHSGIDWMNTMYFYARPDKRFSNETKTSVIIPMDDVKEWEAYLKKVYPELVITKVKDRSETMLESKIYAAWNSEVLIVMNTVVEDIVHEEQSTAVTQAVPEAAAGDSIMEAQPVEMPAYTWHEKKTDSTATIAEMEAAFNLPKDASIISNDRFKKLEKEGNDIAVFVAYDAMMDNLGQNASLGMGAMLLTPAIWKNAAMTTGVNFKDGKIVADMRYYPSDSMKQVAKEAGKDNIDKDLLSRIPAQNLNLALGYHLAPQTLKMILDRLNLTGMANMALMQSGTNVDEILSAFTGDMAVSLNEFSVKKVMVTPDSTMSAMYGDEAMTPYEDIKPRMNFVYAIKIKDRAKLNKLLALAQQQTGLVPSAPDTYQIPLSGKDSISILINDKYLVVSNKMAVAQSFQANNKGNMHEMVSKEIAGHPVGMYFDIKGMLASVDPATIGGGSDAAAFTEVRNLLSDLKMNGGEFKGDANEYHAELTFINKTENSLIQLLNFAQRMAQLDKKEGVAAR